MDNFSLDFDEAGPSSMVDCEMTEDDDLGQNIADLMETTMETQGDDEENEDYDENVVEVEPEIYLDSPTSGLENENSNSLLDNSHCQVSFIIILLL